MCHEQFFLVCAKEEGKGNVPHWREKDTTLTSSISMHQRTTLLCIFTDTYKPIYVYSARNKCSFKQKHSCDL